MPIQFQLVKIPTLIRRRLWVQVPLSVTQQCSYGVAVDTHARLVICGIGSNPIMSKHCYWFLSTKHILRPSIYETKDMCAYDVVVTYDLAKVGWWVRIPLGAPNYPPRGAIQSRQCKAVYKLSPIYVLEWLGIFLMALSYSGYYIRLSTGLLRFESAQSRFRHILQSFLAVNPRVVGSSPTLSCGASSSVGRAAYFRAQFIWPCGAVVNTSACHAEERGFNSHQGRFNRQISNCSFAFRST